MWLGKSQLSRLCPQPRKKSAVMKNVARNSSSEMAADVSLSISVCDVDRLETFGVDGDGGG